MPRLVVTWDRPPHLSAAEADSWLRDEVAKLTRDPDVRRVELARMSAASDRHAAPCEWLCEIDLADDADPAAFLSRPASADWLRDLKLLGMRPTVAVVTAPIVLPGAG